MTQKPLQNTSSIMIELDQTLSFEEICQAINLESDIVIEIVELECIRPQGNNVKDWRFDSLCLKRMKTAASFYHDLEVNVSGVGLALNLLDKIEQLQQRLDRLEK